MVLQAWAAYLREFMGKIKIQVIVIGNGLERGRV
jgi:hypothetical protein